MTKSPKPSKEREYWIKVPEWIYTGGKEVILRYQNPDGEFMESTFYPSDYKAIKKLLNEKE